MKTYDSHSLGYDTTIPFDAATDELNVRLGVLLGGADLSLFVDNALNRQAYLQRSHDTPTSPLYYDLTLRPLTAGATLTYRY